MKFCPECGTAIPIPNAKFCIECGTSLGLTQNTTSSQISSTIPQDSLGSHQSANQYSGKDDEIHIESSDISDNSPYVYTLGTKLEDFVEQILLKQGYTSTEKRQKLRGDSQALNEIDVLAKKDGKFIAVECKNYGEARMVGIKEIRDFQSKLQDLPQIDDAIFVTNARFSSEAEVYSKHNRLVLWDGEKLSRIHYLMNIGRFETSNRDIELPAALPIVMSFDEFAKLSLVNPLSLTLIDSKLTFVPFYLVTYAVTKSKSRFRLGNQKEIKRLSSELEKLIAGSNISKTANTWKDLTHATNYNGHTSYDYEYSLHIVDALSGDILRYSKIDEDKARVLLFLKTNKTRDDILEFKEKNQNIFDLNTIQPVVNYKMKQTGEYALEIKQARVHQSAAERIVMEQVVEDTKSKHHDVKINGSLLIFVPIWYTVIQSKNNDNYYMRQALAASKMVMCDEIELCSRDYSSSSLRKSEIRKTFAACEHCGQVLCKKHILTIDGHYVCNEHAKPTKSTNTDDTSSRFNTIASKVRSVKVSSLYNTDRITNVRSRIFSDPRVIRNASSSKPLTALDNDTEQPTPRIKNNVGLSIFNLNQHSDFGKTQETAGEKSTQPRKITRYTSDGKPLNV